MELFAIPPREPDDGPVWPDEAAEVAFLAEDTAGDEMIIPPAPVKSSRGDAETGPPDQSNLPLPPLQTLVDRIPAEAREVLEELFRARFVSVKRVPAKVLK